MEAAKTGHLDCLARLQEDGLFLSLYASERGTAGEARKAQVWDAALAAYEAGRAHVLAWLFADGWPARIDDRPPWHVHDVVLPTDADLKLMSSLHIPGTQKLRILPDVKLYCAATRTPETACLEVLLDAGCRSEWICPLAAREGRSEPLVLAAERGCLCDDRTLHEAARKGHLLALQTADRYATVTAPAHDPASEGCAAAPSLLPLPLLASTHFPAAGRKGCWIITRGVHEARVIL